MRRSRERRRSEVGVLEIERRGDVVREQVAWRQGRQPVAIPDHLQDRLEAVDRVVDMTAPCVRRDDHSRDPEAHLAEVFVDIGAGPQVGYPWGDHVVEEAAPFVVDDEQSTSPPLG